MSKPALSYFRRVFDALFGPVRWSPPGWLKGLARGVWGGGWRHRVLVISGVAAAGGVLAGWQWNERRKERAEWERRAREEAQRPRVDTVPVNIVSVEVTVPDLRPPSFNRNSGSYVDEPLVVNFSREVAPLLDSGPLAEPESEATLKTGPVDGIKLHPAHGGTWTWRNGSSLIFTPSSPWPAGLRYELTLPEQLELRSGVKLAQREFRLRSAPLEASMGKLEFYTDPKNPALHQVVAELRFTQPVEPADLEKLVRFDVVSGAPLFHKDGQPPVPAFTLHKDREDPARRLWLRSSGITIPEKEDFVRFGLAPGLGIKAGGEVIKSELTGRVKVPDVTSGLFITAVQPTLARNDEGDPVQLLVVETKGYAPQEALAVALEVFQVSPRPGDEPQWESAAQMLADEEVKLTPVKPVAEPDEREFTQSHLFRLPPQSGQQLLVRVRKGLQGTGGFVLHEDYAALVLPSPLPAELSFAGDGGVLALQGERKVKVKARGVSHIRYTLARVMDAQINHLVSMTRGNFESPYFRSGAFGKENVSRMRQEVVPLTAPSEFTSVWTAYDFGPATNAPENGLKGLFFIQAESVKPRSKENDVSDETEEPDYEDGEPVAQGDPDWIVQRVSPPPGMEDEEGNGWKNGPSRFVLVTDLGLLVKRNADGSRDVFVQSISQGGPVDGAEVTILAKNGDTVAAQTTANGGHVHFDAVAHLKQDLAPVAILARQGQDLAFIPWSREDRRIDFSRFSTGGVLASEAKALDAFLFSERGIYRPGDTAYLGIAVRPRGWEGSTEGVPVKLEVRNPAGRIVHEADLKLPADGFLETAIPLREDGPTGVYSSALTLPDEARTILGYHRFRVEDFQSDRMKLAVSLPGTPGVGWRNAPDVKAFIELNTLFGFPAAERRVTGKMVLRRASFYLPAFPDYTFYSAQTGNTDLPHNPEIALGEIKTGDDGKCVFDLKLDRWAGASIAYTFYAEAFEADGGRSVAASQSGIYSPLDFIVGYKADGDLNYIGQDAPRKLQFVCAGREGKAMDAPALTLRLSQHRRHSVLVKQDSGSYDYESTSRTTVVSETPFTLPAAGMEYVLPVDRTGDFSLELVNENKTTVAYVAFLVAGKGESGRSLEHNAELEMKLARGDWNSGEEIECSLSAPFKGAGLLTIEREKVLGWQWFRSDTPDSVQRIRVPEALEGGAYVNAAFVRGLDAPEVFTSPLSYAVEPFTANAGRRRTALQLEVPPVIVPGNVMKIGVTSALPSRAVIYAVDEGIHQITNYELPKPLNFFLRQRALEVETWQILDLIIPEFTLLSRSKAFGGDGDGEGDAASMVLNPFKRRREAPVVYWSGIVETGPQKRELQYTVPDYFDGQLTIMAVAAGGAHLGEAQAKCLVRGPFILTPNAPLFAAPGDTFTASLTIANNEDSAITPLTVTLTASENVEILQSPAPVSVAKGKEGTLRFQVRAREPLGNATLTFRVECGAVSSTRRTTLSIRPATPRTTLVQSGWFRQPEFAMAVKGGWHEEFGSRRAAVSALPLNLAAGLEAWLHEFPHGCTEQITSKALARTILSSDASFGFDRAQAAQEMDAVFNQLRARQSPDGGFGLWGRGGAGGIEILTPHVAHFLLEAKEAGYAVPGDVISGALKRLKAMAAATPADNYEAATVARAIYLLTRSGEVTTNYLLNLRDGLHKRTQDDWKRTFIAPWMAASYALLLMEKESRELITEWNAAEKLRPVTAFWSRYDEQPLATRSLSLMLLSRHYPDIAGTLTYEDLKPITEGIARAEFNTYSAASAVLALKAWSGLHKASNIYTSLHEIVPDLAPRLLAPAGAGVVSAPFTAQAERIQFGLIRPQGAPDSGAFFQIIESGFPRALPDKAETQGLEVRRWFENGGKETLQLKVGEGTEMVLSIRNVSGKEQRDIALVDLLPCGFEVESGSLVPGAGLTPGADSVDVREDRNLFYCSVNAGGSVTFRYRVKPVCAGDFILPPLAAASMYDHAVRGHTPAARVSVASRE